MTINGLSSNCLLSFEFDPASGSLNTYCQYYVTEPLMNTSSVSAESVKYGSSLTLNASATGGTNDYTYSFLYKLSTDEDWTMLQDFSAEPTASFKPSAEGDYDLCIKVRDSSETVVFKTFSLKVYPPLKKWQP